MSLTPEWASEKPEKHDWRRKIGRCGYLLAAGCERVKTILLMVGLIGLLIAATVVAVHYWYFLFVVAVIVWLICSKG